MKVCGSVTNCIEAMAAIKKDPFDLVVADIGLGDGADGVETTKQLKAAQPDIRVLILSVRDETIYASRALRAGAGGYIMKRESTVSVLAALRSVFSDVIHLSPAMKERVIRNHVHGSSEHGVALDLLTDRELEVFHFIGHGFHVRKIASDLGLSRKTIEAHREHIKKKLDFKSSRELARFAVQSLVDGQLAPVI